MLDWRRLLRLWQRRRIQPIRIAQQSAKTRRHSSYIIENEHIQHKEYLEIRS